MVSVTPQIPLSVLTSPPADSPDVLSSPPPYTPLPSIAYIGPSIFRDNTSTPLSTPPSSPTVEAYNPHLRAALREFQATQDPSNWGRRPTHPRRHQEVIELEREDGWKGWALYLVGLLANEVPVHPSRGISVNAVSGMPPYGW